MAIASGAQHGLRYVVETMPGITPTTPQTASLRHTSCSLGISRDSISSKELRDDRQVSAVRSLADKIQGNIAVELSYGEYDELFAASLAGAWTGDVLKAGVMKNLSLWSEHSVTLGVMAFLQVAIATRCP